MEKRDEGLEKLVKIYLNLSDEDKGKIILLGEGLIKSQKIITDEIVLSDNNGNEVKN
jgi:hypothetical protein